MATIELTEQNFEETITADGILVSRQAGALPAKAFDELIAAVEGLDMDEVRAQIAAEAAESPAQA